MSDNLSKAASAIWRINEHAGMDYALDGSGDCGSMIAAAQNARQLEAIAEHGFTAETYNAELRARLAPEYPHMSYGTYCWLQQLEVESAEEFHDNNTYVDTGGELSSLAYLKAGAGA